MGTEFYLARADNRSLFALGKDYIKAAFYYYLDCDTPRQLHSWTCLVEDIEEAVLEYQADWPRHGLEKVRYIVGAVSGNHRRRAHRYAMLVADRIERWAEDRPVLFGSGQVDDWWQWDVTGSRYTEDYNAVGDYVPPT